MAKLPTINNLNIEDVAEDQRSWFEKMLQSLNRFMSSTVAALNRGLTFDENFRAFTKTVTYIHIASGSFKVANPLSFKPMGVFKMKIDDISPVATRAGITFPIDFMWDMVSDGSIKITPIGTGTGGLVVGNT